jgi:hypothetical protein
MEPAIAAEAAGESGDRKRDVLIGRATGQSYSRLARVMYDLTRILAKLGVFHRESRRTRKEERESPCTDDERALPRIHTNRAMLEVEHSSLIKLQHYEVARKVFQSCG